MRGQWNTENASVISEHRAFAKGSANRALRQALQEFAKLEAANGILSVPFGRPAQIGILRCFGM